MILPTHAILTIPPKQSTRNVTQNYGLGAMKELVYSARLCIKEPSAGSKEAQTRDIQCVINELAEAKFQVPIDLRLNEISPTELTPKLQLFKKDEGTGLPEAMPIVAESTVKLGDKVYL